VRLERLHSSPRKDVSYIRMCHWPSLLEVHTVAGSKHSVLASAIATNSREVQSDKDLWWTCSLRVGSRNGMAAQWRPRCSSSGRRLMPSPGRHACGYESFVPNG